MRQDLLPRSRTAGGPLALLAVAGGIGVALRGAEAGSSRKGYDDQAVFTGLTPEVTKAEAMRPVALAAPADAAGSARRFGRYAADWSPTTDIHVCGYPCGTNTLLGISADDSDEPAALRPGTRDESCGLFAGEPATTVKGHVHRPGTAAAGNAAVRPASQSVTIGDGTSTSRLRLSP